VESSLVTATVPVAEEFCWTTFDAMAQNQISKTVNTATGADNTVDSAITYLSLASRVLLQTTDVKKTFKNNFLIVKNVKTR